MPLDAILPLPLSDLVSARFSARAGGCGDPALSLGCHAAAQVARARRRCATCCAWTCGSSTIGHACSRGNHCGAACPAPCWVFLFCAGCACWWSSLLRCWRLSLCAASAAAAMVLSPSPRRRARRQRGASLDACSCPVLPGLPLRCVLPAAWRLLVWGPPALVAAPPPPAQGRVGWRTRRSFYLFYTFLSIPTCLFSVRLALLANTE